MSLAPSPLGQRPDHVRIGDLVMPTSFAYLRAIPLHSNEYIYDVSGSTSVSEPSLVIGFTGPDAGGDRWPIVFCLRTYRVGRCWLGDEPEMLATWDGRVVGYQVASNPAALAIGDLVLPCPIGTPAASCPWLRVLDPNSVDTIDDARTGTPEVREPVLVIGFTAPDGDGDRWPVVYCVETNRTGRCWLREDEVDVVSRWDGSDAT